MTAYEKQKKYLERRSKELGEVMDTAIETFDKEKFSAAYTSAFYCMKKKERSNYQKRFLEKYLEMEGRK